MKKKYTTTAYMRDAENYSVSIYNLEDYFLVVKKIHKVKSPWITHFGINVMDNGFYMLECTPKNENYSMRVFYNHKKEPLLYYFDITNENGLCGETFAPYYIDIYTDIMICTKDNKVVVIDEDELEQAFKNNEITKDEFDKANRTTKNLYNELVNNTNIYKNLDLIKYLN